MKRYDNYKDSGINWIGEIPAHWEVKKIKHNFKLKKEKSFEENPVILSLTQKGIKIRDISNNEGQIATTYDGYHKVNKGDIVLNPMDLLSGFVDSSPYEGVISPAYSILKEKKELVNEYYNRFLQIQYYNKYLFSLGEGVSQIHRWTLKTESLLNLDIIEPPINEQIAIIKYLEQKTSQIDAVIKKKKELIENLKEYRQSLITEVVTKGLNKDVEMKDSGIEWIGEIPKHWNEKKIKHVVNLSNKNSTGEDMSKKYIGLENVSSWTGKLLENIDDKENIGETSVNFFKKDVIFGKLRPYLAKSLVVDFDGRCSPEFLVLRSKSEIFNKYLNYLMLNTKFIDLVNSSTYGTKMPRANWEFISNVKFGLPPIEEQKKIVNYLEIKINKIDAINKKLVEQINSLEEYRQSLISEVVTGKIKVDN